MTPWTKFSDKLPPEEMEQVFSLWPNEREARLTRRRTGETWAEWIGFMRDGGEVLWHPIVYPEVPTEPTQSDRDNDAMLEAWRSQGIDFAHATFRDIQYAYREGFLAALAYERAEVARLVAPYRTAPDSAHKTILLKLAERCGFPPHA